MEKARVREAARLGNVKEHQGGATLPERPCTQTSGQQLRESDDLVYVAVLHRTISGGASGHRFLRARVSAASSPKSSSHTQAATASNARSNDFILVGNFENCFFKSPNMRWLRLPAPESVQVLALALLVGIVFYQVLTAHSALALSR